MIYRVTSKNLEITDTIRRAIDVDLARLDVRLRHFKPESVRAVVSLERHPRRKEYFKGKRVCASKGAPVSLRVVAP
jgi:ribosome-associated translation inhibitor RaiA